MGRPFELGYVMDDPDTLRLSLFYFGTTVAFPFFGDHLNMISIIVDTFNVDVNQ